MSICRVLAERLLVVGLGLISLNAVCAQNMMSLTVDDGLSQGYGAAVACDEDGYIWAGTLNGLNRFNGHTFQNWYEQPGAANGLNSNFVVTLLPDQDGLLWLSTSKSLQVMNRRTGEIRTVECLKRLGEFAIQSVIRTSSGKLWVTDFKRFGYISLPAATSDLSEIAKQAAFFEAPQHLGKRITSMVDFGDSLLLTTDYGVFFYNINQQTYSEVKLFPREKPVCAARTPDGTILVRYARHLYAYNSKSGLKSWPLELQIWNNEDNIIQANGEVYILAIHGIYKWTNDQPEYQEIDKNVEIISGAVDHSGQVWMGTNAQGIRVMKPSRSGFRTLMRGVSIGGAMLDYHDQIWIPVKGEVESEKRYRLLDKKQDKLTRYFAAEPSKDILFTENGDYWRLETADIIKKMDVNGHVYKETVYRLRTIPMRGGENSIMFGPLKSGELVICDYNGNLLFYNPVTHSERTVSYDHLMDDGVAEVKGLTETPDGRIWLSTNGGLLEIEAAGLQWKLIGTKGESGKTISAEKVNGLITDPEDSMIVWAGTSHGLNRIDCRTGNITSFTKKDGLNDDFIYTILPGKPGEFWLGTNHGLLRFNKHSHQVVQYTVADGLPASEFNTGMAWAGKDSTLYFGTVGGLVYFNPYKMPPPIENPGVRISTLEVNGQPYSNADSTLIVPAIPYASAITLQPWENNLAFRFTVMDFFNYEKYNCRYMLEGADHSWRYAWSNNLITYANLSPGQYTFWVSAGNGEGGWSEPRKLVVTIRPYWWFRWWACLIWLGCAVVFVWLVIRINRRMGDMRRQLEIDRLEARYRKELEDNKTKMFVNIAHEIRTPLTILMGLAEEIREIAGPRVESQTARIQQSGQQLLDVVRQITDLIKLEQSGLVLHPRFGDLTEFVRTIAESFLPVTRNRKITLHLNLPEGPLSAEFDPKYLQPVIANLLSNAVKFTPRGGNIEVSLCSETTGVRIGVKDSGAGISAENLPYIFDRYYQVNGGSPDNPGTGIGLTYVSELVKLMHGTIRVESTPGEGSVFTILLPFVTEGKMPEEVNSRVFSPPVAGVAAPAPDNQHKPLVLVVEDNHEMAVFITEVLQSTCQVRHAANGAEGLKTALDQVPDIIITDVMMPEMNGFDFCAAIKNEPVTSHIPVIMLTARAEDTDKIQGLRKGADIYLTKPFSREMLLLSMHNLLTMREQLRAKWLNASVVNPPAEPHEAAGNYDLEFIRRVTDILGRHFADAEFGVDELCRAVRMSHSQLHRKLLALTGNTPGQMIRAFRLERSKDLLVGDPQISIAVVAYSSGFRDPNYFSQAFAAAFGKTPRQYRQEAAAAKKR